MSVVVALLLITTTLKIDTFSAGLSKDKNKTQAQKSQWPQDILSDIKPEKSWWTTFSNCCFHPVNSRKQYLGCCHYKWECLTRGRLTRKCSPWKQTKFRNKASNCSPNNWYRSVPIPVKYVNWIKVCQNICLQRKAPIADNLDIFQIIMTLSKSSKYLLDKIPKT